MGVRWIFPQPGLAIILSTLAGATLVAGWWSQARDGLNTGLLPLIFFLVVAISAAYRFPIHISHQLKVEMTTIPTYLIAVLLPTAPLAATAAGVGILTGELIMRARRGNYWSDVVTAASRCTLVVFVSSGLGHLVTRDVTIHLVAVAVSLWAGDLLTVPLVLGPMSGEPPHRIISTVARETFLSESVQYMLGMVGALAALAQTWALLLLVVPTGLVYLAFTSVTEMQAGTRQMLERMADMVDLRDPTTGGHSRRVAELARHILRELDVQGPEADLIIAAARIHDIGKIGIPDQVLNKAGPLTPAERAIMETHAERGAELLLRYPDFARGVAVVRHHHEAWDGSGYPDRLRGLDIPFGARVVAVADSYDAMTTKRPYRQAMPVEKAALILRQGRAQQWDPAVVDACLRVIAGRLAPVEHPHVAEATPRGESIEQPA
jgi:putative nucleotidyltransferase with HDIG domain